MIKALLSFFILYSLAMAVHGQQNYSGLSLRSCDNIDSQDSSLYACNGQQQSCKAFLIFKAQPPFNTVRTISNLTLSSPEELSRVNNEAEYEAVFPTNKEVVVPVNCSCFDQHYQANASVTVGPDSDTYYRVATELFQGLSTCESLIRENRPLGRFDLVDGLKLRVPLRCACPTKNQIGNGTKYLLTYPVNEEDNIPDIANRFNVSSSNVFEANGLSENDNPTIFAGVSILIPLPSEPLSSQTVTHKTRRDDDTKPKTTFHGLGPKKPKSKRINLFVVFATTAGISVSVLVLVVVAVVFFARHKKRKRSSELTMPNRQPSPSPEDLRIEIAGLDKGPRVFGIEEIKKATEGFGPENRIKGSVYRGAFGENGTVVFAVKKTKKDASKEVSMLKRLNHFNLTKLEGVCTHRGRYYMVFEYMENGSLREWLLLRNNRNNKSWTKRIEIALDIAHGLNYLHSFTEPGYVHKNIKTSNILLDKDLRAKIANFGLAGPAADSTASHVVGTRGYVAPEYLANGVSTTKIDVFAFGVVVSELLSGKKAVLAEEDDHGKQVSLSSRIVEIMESGDVGELDSFVDCVLREDERFREFALRVAKLSVACLDRDPERRPSMSEVESRLSKILADLLRTE